MLPTFLDWINQDAQEDELFPIIIFSLIASLFIYNVYFILKTLLLGSSFVFGNYVTLNFLAGTTMSLAVLAFMEEMFFRYFLLTIFAKSLGIRVGYIYMLFCSAFFGFCHLYFIQSVLSFFLGYILCLVFLKCGGANGKYFQGTVCATIVHTFYNLYITVFHLFII